MTNKLGPNLAIVLAVCVGLMTGCGDSNLKKARRFQSEKDYAEAVHFYKLVLEKDPENTSARYGLIETYAKQLTDQKPEDVTPEKAEEVMAELQPIAKPLMGDQNIKRYISLVYQMMAKRYAEDGRDDKAADAWAEVIQIEPSFAEAHFNLGVALTKAGKYEEALSCFEKAVDLNPFFSKGYYAMGDCLLNLDRNEEATKQYMKALELNPDDPVLHHNLGVAYFRLGDNKKAAEEYKKTIEIEPGFAFAYKSLHDLYEKTGDKEKMKEIDEKWKEISEAIVKARKEEQAPPSEDLLMPVGEGGSNEKDK